jgi:hypothetical protein
MFPNAETVELEEPQSPVVPAEEPAKPDKPKEDEAVRELRRQLKEERKARQEAEAGVRHWYDRATAGAAAPKPEPEPEPEAEIDVIDAITSKGAKGLEEVLAKMGYVKKKDVDASIGQTRAEVTQEAQLVARYPDITDESSEFYQTTLEIYKDLAADPVMRKSPALLEKAAKQAARVLGMEEAPKGRGRGPGAGGRDADDLDDTEDERERERVARVGRQAGDRGRRPASQVEDEGELSGMQKSIVAKFRAAGADITEDGYKKRAQRGIQMSGLPTRRRR